ncbi:arabinogalactan endo-1,4-beta-galactosidase [Auriculariales sp. MPI-PUGE-AT-0066]|nr:arabinogalactan endo-1,4-beta-galactosidase [Auriculariales sp. MPI-PUGE-AT-0066]
MRFIASLLIAFVAIAPHARGLVYRGADISSVPVVEAAGITYKETTGASGKYENIIKAHGANAVRIRVWTAGTYNTAFALSLAKRIKAAGLTLMVDLHYSDTWADPAHQSIPSGWGSTLAALNTAIYNYTLNLVQQFNNQGTPIDVLQIGNEINGGFLWPVGQIANNVGWNNTSQLLHSARNGAKDGGFTGKVMIHLANGWDNSAQTSWYQKIQQQGAFTTADFDIIGVSFYPFYGTSATLSNLQTALTNLANTYGKPLIVAETDWPATACSTTLSASYAKSPAGQVAWSQAIVNVLKALPNGLGQGLLYWEPGWIGNAGLGSSCADNLLVGSDGTSRSSVRQVLSCCIQRHGEWDVNLAIYSIFNLN